MSSTFAPSRRRPGARTQELYLWAGTLALACVMFGEWPQLDLRVSALFVQPGFGFVGQQHGWVLGLYHWVPWVTRAVGVLLVILLCLWRLRVLRLSPAQLRRASALLFCLVVGTGLMVNGVLKETWGRPRPHEVQPFGGALSFVPALVPSNLCSHNCSFVSGHAASGFALIGLGVFAAPARRRYWVGVGLVAGFIVGLGRVMQGGHFASDIVFSGLVMWGCALLLRWGWLRWRVRANRRRRARSEALVRGGT